MPLPLGLERSHVDDDAAAGIRGLAEADRQHVARNPEVFDRAGEREGIWGDDADRPLEAHAILLVEGLRIDDGRIDVRERPELVRAAHVVAVARGAVGDDSLAAVRTHLPGLEGLDHAVRLRHPANPVIRFDTHGRDSSAESGARNGLRTGGRTGARTGPPVPDPDPDARRTRQAPAAALCRSDTEAHDSGRMR